MVGVVDTSVLVLNRSFLPVHLTSVRRALTLFYVGLARAVNEQFQTFDFKGWSELAVEAGAPSVGLVGRSIRVPRVILLTAYDRVPKRQVRFSRYNIYARDQNTCQYCGKTFATSELNLDHVIPRSQGGTSTWDNVVCCCPACNRRKGGCTPEQAGLKLLKTPVRPRWTPYVALTRKSLRYREWLPFVEFINAAYWNAELERE